MRILGYLASVFLLSILLSCPAYAMTVVLDPGHGGEGTSGSGAIYEPYVEKELNFSVATRVKDELEDAGITVYMTRGDDEALSLEERADIAASYDADLLVSLHFNSSGPHDKAGSEVWTSFNEPFYEAGKAIGEHILEGLNDLGFANKGVKVREGDRGDYYGIIRNGTAHGIPTIIVEHCFIDNVLDRLLLESAGVDALAHADAQGIIRYVTDQGGLISVSHSVTGDDTADSTAATQPSDRPSEAHSIRESKLIRKDTMSHGFSVAHKAQQ